MLYDGSVVPVQNVKVGDLLMGPDSLPRKVVSLARGREELFRITPTKGDSYIVNRSHILSLRMTGFKGTVEGYRAGDIANISVDEYLRKNKTFQHCAKGWRTGVDFPKQEADLLIPPYILGAWLGDGTSRLACITTADFEVKTEWENYIKSCGLNFNTQQGRSCESIFATTGGHAAHSNIILNNLRNLDVIQNKHIPKSYLTASRKDRLELLAGLLDTDGHYDGRSYSVTFKQKCLADDTAFLCRSLGFAAYVSKCVKRIKGLGFCGEYYRISISGHLDTIPNRVERRKASPRKINKNVLNIGISVDSVGEGEYYGFELSGPDRLFLLGDFTVTHNTILASSIIESAVKRGSHVLFLAHRKELIDQASRKLDDFGIDHGVIMAKHWRRRPAALVQVASVQTLRRRDLPAADLVIIDEAHLSIAKTYTDILAAYPKAVVLGLTATPMRADGKPLSAIYHDIVAVSSVPQLIRMGFLVRPRHYAPSRPDLTKIGLKGGDYEETALAAAVDKPDLVGHIVEHWKAAAAGRTTAVFAVNIAHSQHIVAQFRAAGIAAEHVDGMTPKHLREAILDRFASGETTVVSSVGIMTEGYDNPRISAIVLARPTLSLALYLQMAGRGLRIHPETEKQDCIILDHAGCAYAHGFADEEREWSLDGRKRSNTPKREAPVRTCTECFCAYPAAARACPECGHIPDRLETPEIEQDESAKLVEVTDTMRLEMIRAKRREEARAETLQDLLALARQRGYAPGWAHHRYAARMRKHA